MDSNDSKTMIFELADSVARSWWTIIAGICIGIAGASIALAYIPKVYQAHTRLLIVPQAIPTEFVRTTVTEDMTRRVAALGENVFDQSNMTGLVTHHFGMPEDPAWADAMIRSVRSRIEVQFDSRNGILLLAYEDADPARAAAVSNDLAELYVNVSASFRQTQVKETTETIRARASEYEKELDAKKKELNRFHQDHYLETSESLPTNLQQIETRQENLEENLRRQADLREQIPVLRARLELAESDASGVPTEIDGMAALDPVTQQLRTLQSQLDALRIQYKEAHPKVQLKKREIADLKARAELFESTDPDGNDEPSAGPTSPLLAQINSYEKQLVSLIESEAETRRDLRTLERRIAATPRVQTQLEQLTAERDMLAEKFHEFQSKLETAEDAQTLEESENAQQIQLVDRARIPNRPVQPQPLKVYLVGLALGCLLFVAPLPARRLLNPIVASENGLRAISDVPVLISIPKLQTQEVTGLSRLKLMKNVSLSVLSSVFLFTVFYFFGITW